MVEAEVLVMVVAHMHVHHVNAHVVQTQDIVPAHWLPRTSHAVLLVAADGDLFVDLVIFVLMAILLVVLNGATLVLAIIVLIIVLLFLFRCARRFSCFIANGLHH